MLNEAASRSRSAADVGGESIGGIIAHLHCIVTGGALSPDGKQWRSPKQRKFLFPVQALAALFRGKFLAGLRQMLGAEELHLPDSELKTPATRARWLSLLYTKRWVLYAKRPFGGPQQVLRYLANYTHRVALSNRRIVAVDPQQQTVTFTYRDYRHGSKLKELTLCALEFLRRSACISSLRDSCASDTMESLATIAGSVISKQPARSSNECLNDPL